VEAYAGKTRGAIERLLIEHTPIRQNAGAIGKIAMAAVFMPCQNKNAGKILFIPALPSPRPSPNRWERVAVRKDSRRHGVIRTIRVAIIPASPVGFTTVGATPDVAGEAACRHTAAQIAKKRQCVRLGALGRAPVDD